MRKHLFIVLCLLISGCHRLWAQEKYEADSLLQLLPNTTGIQRVEVLKQLSRSYIGVNKEKALDYARQTVSAAKALGNDSMITIGWNNMAAALQNVGDKRSSLPYLDSAIELSRANGREKQLLESLEFKATAYAGMRKMDKAVAFAREGLVYAEKLKDTVGILNGMEIIAAGYKELKQLKQAIEIYRQEMALLEHLPKRLFEKGRTCVNLGIVLYEDGQKQEANDLFARGKKYFEQFNYPVGALVAALNLADSYMDESAYTKAGPLYQEILATNQSIGDPELEAIAHTGLGTIELEKRQYATAVHHFKQAEAAAQPAALYTPLKELYSLWADVYSLQGDYETAKTYKQLSEQWADSLLNADVREKVVDYQTQYETAQKESELVAQKLTITEQKSEIFRKNTLNYGLVAALLALIVLGYLFYNRYRLRKKAELDAAVIREQQLGLQAVIEAQEAERKRIAKDLHDGIAQEMAAIRLGFSALQQKLSGTAPDEAAEASRLARQLDDSCTGVRSIAYVMMPPVLEQQGLAPSLEMLLRNTFNGTQIQYEFSVPRPPGAVDAKVALGLYRIAQELLNNILKHAKANKVAFLLYETGQHLVLQVEDDGVGFNFEQVRSRGTMGLLNIFSRVNALKGVFQTEQAQPHGTLTMIRVPIG